jgi:hypothetical protein
MRRERRREPRGNGPNNDHCQFLSEVGTDLEAGDTFWAPKSLVIHLILYDVLLLKIADRAHDTVSMFQKNAISTGTCFSIYDVIKGR